jgi:hypothetical protein
MLRALSEAAAIALSLVALVGPSEAGVDFPDQCWPNCVQWYETQQCQAWFGPTWYYCGWSNGYTWCCGGE